MGNSNQKKNSINRFETHDIAQGIPGGFFIYHADGNEELIYVNDVILQLFQCETTEEFRKLTGNSFRGIVHPDDLEWVEESIARQIASDPRGLDYVEYRIIQKDGSVRWVEDFGHFVHSESEGDIFYVFISDITERMQERDKERISHQKMMDAANSREKQYITAITSDAVALYEVNLTKDLIEGRAVQYGKNGEEPLLEPLGLSSPCRYTDFVKRWGKQLIASSRQDYYDHFSPEYLLLCYEKGNLDPWYNYWVKDAANNWIYIHQVFVLTEDTLTGDILAIALLKDHTDIKKKMEENIQQSEMIQALCVDYTNVYWVNLSRDTSYAYRMSSLIIRDFGNRFQEGSYWEHIRTYVETVVYEPDREMLLARAKPEYLMKVLETEVSCTVNYRVERDGAVTYYQMKVSRVQSAGEDVEVVVGFGNVDREVRSELEQRKQLEDTFEIISGLSREYDFIGLIESESGSMSVYKNEDESMKTEDILSGQKSYYDAVSAYGKYVIAEDREIWFTFTRMENVMEQLEQKPIYSVNVRSMGKDNKRIDYVQFNFTRVSPKEKGGQLVMARKVITETIERELRQRNLLRRYELLFVSATADVYSNLLRVDLETWDTIRMDIKQENYAREDMGKWERYLERRLQEIAVADRENVRKTLSPGSFEAAKVGDKLVCSYESIPHEENDSARYYSVTARVQGEGKQRFATIFTIDNTELVEKERKQKQLLENALAQAQHANSAKTTFLSNMSHDMRTPMNAIIGFSAIAASHIDNTERVRDCLEKIMSSSNHLLSLINDILDMSRIESDKVQIQEKECNLSEQLHSLVNIIQPQVKAKQLEFFIDTFNIKNENVYADPLKLNQILINILGNAVKFTPAGGIISLRIRQEPCGQKGFGVYEFSVKDTGIGMSREFVEHIFEPFERENTTVRSGIEGTGLGMAITKNIVDMMGGDIEVNSVKGKGTEFLVRLRFRLQEDNGAGQRIAEMEGLRALVVDDDFNTCDSVTRMLGEIGMRSEWTTSAREAVFRAQKAHDEQDPFHTYILDMNMPEQNGIETARRIRKVVGEDIPIIILTAYDWADLEEEAKEAGIAAFCSKPLFMSDLKNVLLKANHLTGTEADLAEQSFTREDFSGKRVLVVEDNELNREIAAEILKEAGFVVEMAVDGSDAVCMVEKSEENYYDIILTDIQMPVMDGYEEVVAIRSLPRRDVAKMPIIAMTANAFEEDKALALKCGMNGHIAKPLDINAMFEILSRYLKG